MLIKQNGYSVTTVMPPEGTEVQMKPKTMENMSDRLGIQMVPKETPGKTMISATATIGGKTGCLIITRMGTNQMTINLILIILPISWVTDTRASGANNLPI